MGSRVRRVSVIAACVVGAVLIGATPLSAQTAAPYIRVPHPAGTVYVPIDPSTGQPAFPATAPAAPASPSAPASPAAPTPEPGISGGPTRGGGFSVIPPSRDRVDPPGSGFQVVPRP